MEQQPIAPARVSPHVLSGMRDFLPQTMILRQQIIDTFRSVFERYGFEPIDTPLIERYEVLAGKYGEEGERLMYRFQDHGGREVGLRYDLTVPLARFVAAHRSELTFPFKRYHIGPVFRAERPQRGRYRQFWQCDIDTVGTRSMLADAEIVQVWLEALRAVGLHQVVVHVNHRGLLQGLVEEAEVAPEQSLTVFRALDKLAKIGPDGVLAEMEAHNVPRQAAQRLLALAQLQGEPAAVLDELDARLQRYPHAQQAIAELRELFRYLNWLGVASTAYVLDLTLARGLDYYTGPVFEAMVTEPAIGSLGGAGRYDRLIGMFLGEEIPATGGSLGLERVVEVVQELHLLTAPSTVSDAMVVLFDPASDAAVLGLLRELREAGLNAEAYLGERRDLRRQLQYADRKGIPFALFYGTDEVAAGVVTVRDLRTGEQQRVPRDHCADYLRQRVHARRSPTT
ncbi:histidine--tRNA ligase [Thermorudis peleae]|uniref:histidine--tRNA ligase n=1 Tax=Thermorudis peleae TaxID=1382356 RepID=UPI0005716D51|nr:histidine--tRNA ligase [Thermorudis peleae]